MNKVDEIIEEAALMFDKTVEKQSYQYKELLGCIVNISVRNDNSNLTARYLEEYRKWVKK